MSKIPLCFPREVKVTGALYDRSNVYDLTQDMLQLELPAGIVIDVGWYPQWDPSGTYMILVFQDTTENMLEERIRTCDHHEIEKMVDSLLRKYLSTSRGSGNTVQVDAPVHSKTTTTCSASTTTTTPYGLGTSLSPSSRLPIIRSPAPAQLSPDGTKYVLISQSAGAPV